MFEEAISSLLSDLGAEGVFSLLTFLEELGNFFETWIGLFLLLLGLFDVVEEELICLVVDLLSRALGLGVDEAAECINPVDFLFGHSNHNY